MKAGCAIALLLGVATLAIAGCGGGGGTSGTASSAGVATDSVTNATTTGAVAAPTPLSRARLTAAANAICKRLHAQLGRLVAGKTPRPPQETYSRAAAYEGAALGKLRQLTPPAAIAADWKQILAAMSTLAADSAKYAEDASAKNLGAASGLANSYGSIKRPAVATATRDGLGECAQAL